MQVALSPARAMKKTIYMNPIKISKASDVYHNFDNLRNSFAAAKCSVSFATMSFAGPVSQDHVVITNWQCEARERVIHFTTLPFDLFPLDRRLFMNDLEAASYGIIARFIKGSLPKIFAPLWCSDPDSPILTNLDGSSLVLWLGAGFFGSFISRKDSADYNCVVSSEAGHAQVYSVPPWDPSFEKEKKFISFVSQKLHGEVHQPEWEDFCGHRGLELAYQFIKLQAGKEMRQPVRYDEIRNRALAGDTEAMEAFKIHYTFIIRAAQSMVLTVRCKRVFIISETQVKNFSIVQSLAPQLHEQFIKHPRTDWFKEIEVYVQHSTSTFPLSGGLFLSKMFSVAQQKQNHMI
jgi:glucokinase